MEVFFMNAWHYFFFGAVGLFTFLVMFSLIAVCYFAAHRLPDEDTNVIVPDKKQPVLDNKNGIMQKRILTVFAIAGFVALILFGLLCVGPDIMV